MQPKTLRNKMGNSTPIFNTSKRAWIIAVLLIIFWILYDYYQDYRFNKYGHWTVATIKKVQWGKNQKVYFDIKVNNKIYSANGIFNDYYGHPEVGDVYPVIYMPDNPYNCLIVFPQRSYRFPESARITRIIDSLKQLGQEIVYPIK